MSLFDQPNQDALSVSLSDVSAGPRLGFLENFDVAYQATARASSQFGIEKAMLDGFNDQRDALRRVGVEGVDAGVLTNGLDIMQYYNGKAPEPPLRTVVDGQVQQMRLDQYDNRINELKKQYPTLSLRTTREMSDWVKQQAVDAERRAAEPRTTFGGDVGGFIGSSLAGIDPRLNPINTLTLGVGGVGKSVLTRIAAQAGFQGVAETINQVTGVQTEREALGLSHGLADAATRIGAAAAGGALAQGVGEALVFGAKRWFAHTPNDPAPPIPHDIEAPMTAQAAKAWTQEQETLFNKAFSEAYGSSRPAELRGFVDVEHMTRQLDRWDGESPVNIRPPEADMATRFPRDVEPGFEPASPEARMILGQDTLDEIARRADPKVFDITDKITAKQNDLRAQLDSLRPNEAQANAAVQDMTDRINELQDKIKYKRFTPAERDAAGGRPEAKAQARDEVARLTAQRDAELNRLLNTDSPEMAAIRKQITKYDENLRDLAPVVSRAYDRARGVWNTRQEYSDLIGRNMTKRNRTSSYLTQDDIAKLGSYEDALAASAPTVEGLADKAPLMRRADEVTGEIRQGADAADVLKAVAAKDTKTMDEALQQFRDSLDAVLNEKEGNVIINSTGDKIDLNEKIHVPVEDGNGTKEMTVRDFLQQHLDDEQDLKAIQTCSL